MVSRKWLTTLTSAEETSTQVQVAFSAALDTEGLLGEADERATAALRAAIASGDRDRVAHLATGEQLPLLLAISDNGPQMRSVSTWEFMAGVAIAQQFGRPHIPLLTRISGGRQPGDHLTAYPEFLISVDTYPARWPQIMPNGCRNAIGGGWRLGSCAQVRGGLGYAEVRSLKSGGSAVRSCP